MTTYADRKTIYRHTLIAAALATSLGVSGSVLAASGSTAEPIAHSDSVGATISDTVITTGVKAKFLGDDRLKNSDISVTTTNGVVTLTGSAANSEAKSAAASMAKSVDGVKSVDNSLETPLAAGKLPAETRKVATATKKAVTDSWITTKVKSALLADSVAKGFDVSVTTKHGVVMLDGTLNDSEAISHVAEIARGIEGVKSVRTSGLKISNSAK